MNKTTIYARTAKGDRAASAATPILARNLQELLKAIDGRSTVEDLQRTNASLSAGELDDALLALSGEEYIVEAAVAAPPVFRERRSGRSDSGTEYQRRADDLRAKIKAKREGVERPPTAGDAGSPQPQEPLRRAEEREAASGEADRARPAVDAQALQRIEEEARRKVEEEFRRKAAEDEVRRKAEEEALRKAEEDVRRMAEEEARRKAEEQARRKAEEEARRKAEEEVRRKAEEQARRKAEEEARRKAEEEARRKAEEEARRKAEEEARRKAEEEARRKAEEEARRKAEEQARRMAEEEARLQAEEDARRKAEEDARKKAEEDARKKAEKEARKKAEEEAAEIAWKRTQVQARLLAEDQAWQEEQAQAMMAAAERAAREAEEKAKQAAQASAAASAKTAPAKGKIASRTPPKRGKLIALALVALLVAGLVALHLISFDGQIPRFQELVGVQLQEPVKISALRIGLVPQPHLRLEGVSIGAEGQIKAPLIKATGEIGNLYRDKKVFKSVEFDSLVVTEEGLGWIMFSKLPTRDLVFDSVDALNTTLESKNISLPAFDAKIAADDEGGWKTMVIQARDKTFRVELTSKGESAQIELAAQTFKVPFGSRLTLEDFAAKGTVKRTGLDLTEFKAFAYGGTLAGTARLRWGATWSLAGELNAKQLDTARIVPELMDGGRVAGDASYAMQAPQAAKLFAAPRLEGSLVIPRGTLLGTDVGSLVQGGEKRGDTKFTDLSAGFLHEAGATQFRQARFGQGGLSASGSVEVDANDTVRGRFAADLKLSTELQRANLTLSGTLKKIEWRRQ